MIDYSKNFSAFYQDIYTVEGDYGPRPVVPKFLKTWLDVAFPMPEGDPMARNIMDLRSKKEGKSALAGGVALYMATRRKYSEVVIIAADKDQAKDRVLRSVKYAVENGQLADNAKIYRDIIELDNGSIIQAMSQDWQGAAGGNYSAVIFDELHAWVYENQRRVFDEMVIPPTQKKGVRWVSTYAGFEGESLLLKEWWLLAEKGKRISSELPIFHNEKASLLAFIDVGEESWRMPWMTKEYIEQIRTTERPNTFRRLWLNEWVSSESQFLPDGTWDSCYSPDVKPLQPMDRRKLILGADASTSRDLTALVGVVYDPKIDMYDVVFVRSWKPQRGIFRQNKPTIDLDETIGKTVEELHKAGKVAAVVYDPYQLHSLAIRWSKSGIKTIELPQTTGRIKSDQNLYDVIIGQRLRHYNDPTLNEHIQNAVVIETSRGIRLAKEKTSKKIDLAVALSMALQGASDNAHLFQKRTQIIKDPFYMWPPPEGYEYTPQFGYQPPGKINKNPHPPGVTWENCKYRQRGCLACLEEQQEAIEQEEEELKRGVQSERYLSWMGKQQDQELLEAIQSERNAKQAESVNLFWKNIRNKRSK